jgi:predicted TIM-barrel fold metal-dependent hydrolase
LALVDAFGGVGPFIFASDWPHHDFDHPRHVLRLPFPPADRARIMGDTARTLFNLPANPKAKT